MNKKHTVLFIETGRTGGGSFESLHEILRHLDRDFFDPLVVFFTENRFEPVFAGMGITVYRLYNPILSGKTNTRAQDLLFRLFSICCKRIPKLSMLFEYIFHFRTLRRLRLISRDREVDLIHLNNQIGTQMFGAMLSKRLSIPCISFLRSPNLNGFNRVKAAYANRVISRYVAYLEDIRDRWIANGVDESKTTVLHNGITPFSVEPADLHKKYGISPDKQFILGCIGRVIPYRGFDLAIAAFAHVLRDLPHALLLIVGVDDTIETQKILNQAEDLDLTADIKFIPFEKDLRPTLASLSALLLPYRQCPFGRVLLEAWQTRTPVVASDVPPIRNIAEHGKHLLLVDPANAENLSAAIVSICRDPELRRRITDAAYNLCNERFTMSGYIRSLQDLYKSVLHEHER